MYGCVRLPEVEQKGGTRTRRSRLIPTRIHAGQNITHTPLVKDRIELVLDVYIFRMCKFRTMIEYYGVCECAVLDKPSKILLFLL